MICAHRPECDGCPLIEQPESAQHALKAQALRRDLGAWPELSEPAPAPLLPAPKPLGYRNRARMVVDPEAPSPAQLLGFYRRGSRELLPITRCIVHDPVLERLLDALRPALWAATRLRAAARFVDARVSHAPQPSRVMLTLCLTRAPDALMMAQVEALALALDEAMGEVVVGTQLNLGGKPQVVLSGKPQVVRGDPWLTMEVGARPVAVSPGAFFQLNLDQLERAHALMREWLGGAPSQLVDLYCGVGAHGLALLAPGGALWGADINPEAIAVAREAAARAGLVAQLRAGADRDLMVWLRQSLPSPCPPMIVNPARAGLHPEVIRLLAELRPQALLYMSCEPATLRRDLARLARQGMRLERWRPMDFMPQTEQVETLALLRPARAPDAALWHDAHWPVQGRSYSEGVSGPAWPEGVTPVASRWIAIVCGRCEARAEAELRVAPIGEVGPHTVVRLSLEGADELALRQRLRAWRHPVVGDLVHGDRAVNHLTARRWYRDRVALHCASITLPDGTTREAPAPGELVAWGVDVSVLA